MKSILIYGASATGKTTECGAFAQVMAERFDAPCLYISADNDTGSCQDQVDNGAMIPIDLLSSDVPLYDLRRLARGYWPANLKDGRWSAGPFTKIEDLFPMRSKGYRISGIICEGLTRFGDLLGNTLKNEMQQDTGEPIVGKFRLRANGDVIQGKALDAKETEDEESFGMDSRGTYSGVQQFTMDYVTRFKGNRHAPALLMTAHQGEGKTSEGISARCLGPVIKGKALVDKAPGWFSSYFHMEVIPAGTWPDSPEMRAMWYQFHPDRNGSGLMWPGKLGATPEVTVKFRVLAALGAPFGSGYMPVWFGADGSHQGGIKGLAAMGAI